MRHQAAAGNRDTASRLTGYRTERLRVAVFTPHCLAVTRERQAGRRLNLAYSLTPAPLPGEEPV